jgi:hypothetical protein
VKFRIPDVDAEPVADGVHGVFSVEAVSREAAFGVDSGAVDRGRSRRDDQGVHSGGREDAPMKRKAAVLLLTGMFVLGAASPALADQPPGQLGYEGQPGNQGGGGGNGGGQPPGQLGYEGQPGNQGGH